MSSTRKSIEHARTVELLVAGHRLMEAAGAMRRPDSGAGVDRWDALEMAVGAYADAEAALVATRKKASRRRPPRFTTQAQADELAYMRPICEAQQRQRRRKSP